MSEAVLGNWAGWCARCLSRRPRFERAQAALRFEAPVDHLVHRFKYHGDRGAGRALGEVMADAAAGWLLHRPPGSGPDWLVPMPLHPVRLRERGFNQALSLAEDVARVTGKMLMLGHCVRLENSGAQSALTSRHSRRRNVAGVFRASPGFRGATVAIVDDVLTTGATANALAGALLAQGAARVEVWVCARAGFRKGHPGTI